MVTLFFFGNHHHLGIPLGKPRDPYCCWSYIVVTVHTIQTRIVLAQLPRPGYGHLQHVDFRHQPF